MKEQNENYSKLFWDFHNEWAKALTDVNSKVDERSIVSVHVYKSMKKLGEDEISIYLADNYIFLQDRIAILMLEGKVIGIVDVRYTSIGPRIKT